jgi:hypothetical protein
MQPICLIYLYNPTIPSSLHTNPSPIPPIRGPSNTSIYPSILSRQSLSTFVPPIYSPILPSNPSLKSIPAIHPSNQYLIAIPAIHPLIHPSSPICLSLHPSLFPFPYLSLCPSLCTFLPSITPNISVHLEVHPFIFPSSITSPIHQSIASSIPPSIPQSSSLSFPQSILPSICPPSMRPSLNRKCCRSIIIFFEAGSDSNFTFSSRIHVIC